MGVRQLLTARGSAFLSAGVVLLLGGVFLGVRDLSRLGALLVALTAGSLLLARRHGLRMSVERRVTPSRVSVDATATVRLTVENHSMRRTPVLLAEERIDYALGDRPRFVLPRMDRRGRVHVEYAVRAHARGEHALGPLTVRVRDPFGLTTRLGAVGSAGSVLVLPRIHELTSAAGLGRGVGAEGSIPHRVALHGEDDQAIREYRDGDDLRRIHWPATARTGDLMVRQEDRPAKRRAVILLDRRAEAHGGRGRQGSFEWAVSMAASVAHHLAGQGYAIHLLTDDPSSDLGAREDTEPAQVLETLARVSPGPAGGLRPMLHTAVGATAAGGVVVLVGGALDATDATAVTALRQGGSTGLAFIIDRAAFEHARDPGHRAPAETGDAARATSAALRAAGWSATWVGPHTAPAAAWAATAGARQAALR